METEEGKRENRCRLEEDEERVHVQKPRSRKLIKIIQEIRLNAPREPAEPECFPFRLEPALTSAPPLLLLVFMLHRPEFPVMRSVCVHCSLQASKHSASLCKASLTEYSSKILEY